MEQHAIPQQISSYQFRLVGDMTLKQFFQLAGGALVALLFYAAPLPGYVKWPFIIVSALLGVALAFLPFEERPLERWIAAFFRAVYSPTGFVWQENKTPPVFFQEEAKAPAQNIIAPGGEAALNAYLASSAQPQGFLGKLEQGESGFLSKLGKLFGAPAAAPAPAVVVQPNVPTAPVSIPLPSIPHAPPPQQAEGLKIPTTQFIRVAPSAKPKMVVEEKVPFGKPITERPLDIQPLAGRGFAPGGRAVQFSPEAAPPIPPTTPNTIVGQVLDSSGKIIEGAILEVRDSAGRPVRALKSNKLGHFVVVTPLQNGRYEIITEKDGFIFDPATFDATGEIIPPIGIRARANIVAAEIPATAATL